MFNVYAYGTFNFINKRLVLNIITLWDVPFAFYTPSYDTELFD